jgi:hypothetical protein
VKGVGCGVEVKRAGEKEKQKKTRRLRTRNREASVKRAKRKSSRPVLATPRSVFLKNDDILDVLPHSLQDFGFWIE